MDKSSWRNTINQLIDDIIREIPTDNLALLKRFRVEKQTLAYTAPELVNNSLSKLFDILRQYVPGEQDASKNPQWIINIKSIWTIAIQQINRLESKVEKPQAELDEP